MLTPTAVLAGIGLVSGLGLAVAAKVFAVETEVGQIGLDLNLTLRGDQQRIFHYVPTLDIIKCMIHGQTGLTMDQLKIYRLANSIISWQTWIKKLFLQQYD